MTTAVKCMDCPAEITSDHGKKAPKRCRSCYNKHQSKRRQEKLAAVPDTDSHFCADGVAHHSVFAQDADGFPTNYAYCTLCGVNTWTPERVTRMLDAIEQNFSLGAQADREPAYPLENDW